MTEDLTTREDADHTDEEYAPSTWKWVRDQIAEYEASGGTRANTLRESGRPIIVVTMRGARTGKIRKIALMRIERNGAYALVASKGGDPRHPGWYHNLLAHPDEIRLQDGPEPFDVVVREVHGEERQAWWELAVQAYPPYADYQRKTDRTIPVLVAAPRK